MIARSVPDAAALLVDLLGLRPEQRAMRLGEVGDAASLLDALSEEAERLAAADVARGLAASEMIVALADEIGHPVARTTSRVKLAMAMGYASRYTDSLAVADEAVAVGEAAGLVVESARARLAGVQSLARLGRHDEALALGEAARAALLAADQPALAARADATLGAVHDERDEPAAALVHYDRARSGLADEPVTFAQLETNRGVALTGLDRFVEAEAAFRAAVDAFAAAGLVWAGAVAAGNLAHLASRQGRLEVSLHHFEQARRCFEADDASAELPRLLAEQADTVALLGLPADAVATYARVLPTLERHGLAPEAASAYLGLGRALLRLDRMGEAASALARAASMFDALRMPTARARVDFLRAEIVAAEGRPDEAATLVRGALGTLRDHPTDVVVGRHQLARLALAVDDVGAAARELEAALVIAEALDLAPALADLFHARASVHRASGRSDRALSDLRAAVAQVERVRGALQAERFRAAFLGNRLAIYDDLVAALLDRGTPEAWADAFAVVELAKSRALLDLLSGALDLAEAAEGEGNDPGEAALLADLARLRRQLNWLYSGLGEAATGGASGPAPLDRQLAIAEREEALDQLGARIAVARGAVGLYAPPLNLGGAFRHVPVGGALLEYFVAGQEVIAFVLRDGEVRVFRHLTNPREIGERARRLHFQIGRAVIDGDRARHGARADRRLADVRSELRSLDELLLAPLGDAIAGAERLLIVPHGPLHTLPFHALWDGERHLIERCEVVYAPSASVLDHLTPTPEGRPPGSNALVVGVPDDVAPRTAFEAEHVARALGTERLLLGAAATVERVSRAVRDADPLHFACHGRFAPGSPLGSGLKLSDGWLTVREFHALRIRASLVTLSGCETGRAAIGGGDELVGMMRGLFAAGASSVILSLWIVNDESTAELMTAFYDAWGRGESKPAALRAAQREILARRSHPAFWAPFILGGQP